MICYQMSRSGNFYKFNVIYDYINHRYNDHWDLLHTLVLTQIYSSERSFSIVNLTVVLVSVMLMLINWQWEYYELRIIYWSDSSVNQLNIY